MSTMHSASLTMRVVLSILATVAFSGCGGGGRMESGSPAVVFSATSLSFPDLSPGAISPPQIVTVSNRGTAVLDVTGVAVGANFQEIDDCQPQLSIGAVCTITVTFAPATIGDLQTSITVTDNSPGAPHTITLHGKGILGGPPAAPTLTGYCFGSFDLIATKCAVVQDAISCPPGQVAVKPQMVSGCLPPSLHLLDTAKSCHGKTLNGLNVTGSCIAAN